MFLEISHYSQISELVACMLSGFAAHDGGGMSNEELQANHMDVGVKRRVIDSTRKVVVGPVAHRLAIRSTNRSSTVKRLCIVGLIFGFITCGFIVNAAYQGAEASPIWPSLSIASNSKPTSPAPTVAKVSPVVGSVLELGEAFETLETQDETATKGPLSIERPTAPIAVYSANGDEEADTAQFIEQLGHMDSMETTEPKSGLDSEESEGEETQQATDKSAIVSAESPPTGDANIDPITESVKEELASKESESASDLDIALNSTASETLEKELAATEPEEVFEPQALPSAILLYHDKLKALRADGGSAKTNARAYYAAAAELCVFAHTTNDASPIRNALADIETDDSLFELVSSASSSWIRWPKRTSDGVLVAGRIVNLENLDNELVVSVKTLDKKRSIVRIVAETDSNIAVGQRALVMGMVVDQDSTKIRGILY